MYTLMRVLINLFIVCALLSFTTLTNAAPPLPTARVPISKTETYVFDPNHTYVTWAVNHFGFSRVSGKFMAEGSLTVDPVNPQNSKVDVTIHTNNSNTGIAELDDILKGASFFNITKYPSATFVSNSVHMTGKNTADVAGVLTVRGIAKPVTLQMTLNKVGEHPFYMKKSVGFSGSAAVKRSDFGMTGYLPGVDDHVELYMQSEAQITDGR